jgi:hypothetical protein
MRKRAIRMSAMLVGKWSVNTRRIDATGAARSMSGVHLSERAKARYRADKRRNAKAN